KPTADLAEVCDAQRAPLQSTAIAEHFFPWRGGRAVECAGLENRKTERSREFESHPLRHLRPRQQDMFMRTLKHGQAEISARDRGNAAESRGDPRPRSVLESRQPFRKAPCRSYRSRFGRR